MISNLKISLLFALLFLAIVLKAQFGIWAGYSKTNIKYGSFDQFRASYNKVCASTLKNEMPGFDLSPAYSFGLVGRAKVFHGEISADFLNGKTYAEFTNGEKREFNLNQSIITGGFGLGYGWDIFYIYVIGGLEIGDLLLRSSFIYKDGTQSYGLEKTLNGHNHGFFLGGYYGITTCIPIVKYVKVLLRVSHSGYSRADAKFSLTDIFGSKALTVYGVPHPDGIPTDYEAYIAPEGGYSYKGGYVGTDVEGWRLLVGLHFEFGGFQD